MILPLFRHRPEIPDTISALYGMIVAQARLPAFYRDYDVPDTVDGRFELILLHLFLLLRRFDDEAERKIGQQVFDLFCRDMDRNLREMGVGDLKVPKEMRRIGAAYYGRAKAYEAALASADTSALGNVIARNVYGSDTALGAERLAAYMMDATGLLAGQDIGVFNRGLVHFPEPA